LQDNSDVLKRLRLLKSMIVVLRYRLKFVKNWGYRILHVRQALRVTAML